MQRLHAICGKSTLKPNYFSITTDSMTLISNAHSLVSGEEQYENVNFWDLSTGDLIKTLNFRHDHIVVGCYERWLLGIVYNADVIITLNLATEESIFILDAAPRCLPLQKSIVTPIAISPFEPIIVCGGDLIYKPPQTGQIKAYNLLSEPINREIGAVRLPAQNFNWQPERYPECSSSVLISPDSNTLLCQSLVINQGLHRLWDLHTGTLIRTIATSSSGLIECIAVNKIGQLLACSHRGEQVYVWDLHTDKVICSIDGNLPIAMTIDGRFLAYCRNKNEITLRDLEKNRDIYTIDKSSSTIERIAISPDGKWLVSYNQEQTIEVWHVFQ
jgi:WD40 repeat protein